MAEIGEVRMSYTIDPCGLDGRPINGGNHYANAGSAEDARASAERMLAGPDYLGYKLGSVQVYGREMRFRGDCWADVRGGRVDSFVVTRQDVGAPPLFVTRQDVGAPPLFVTPETRCYDTTVMDYLETVHAMRTDGSCQCGDPTRNVRR